MRLSSRSLPRCVTLLARPDYTHWSSEKVWERWGRDWGREDRQRTGEWDHYLGDGGRKEGWPLVLVCERRPVAFPVYINVLILNWLWGSQRLWKKGSRERREAKWQFRRTIELKMWLWFSDNMWLHCFSFSFFLFSFFLQQWWQMSVKLKWETSRTIFKWLFIGMLGGLTLCPLVSGDRKKSFFLCFILIIKKYKAFFNNFFVNDWETSPV